MMADAQTKRTESQAAWTGPGSQYWAEAMRRGIVQPEASRARRGRQRAEDAEDRKTQANDAGICCPPISCR